MANTTNAELQRRREAATPRGVAVMAPFSVARAENSELWDVVGKRYVDFGGGILRVPYDTDLDVFVVKLTSAGAHTWSKKFTNTGNDRGYGIAVGAQGTLAIAGYFSNGIDFGGGQFFSQTALRPYAGHGGQVDGRFIP